MSHAKKKKKKEKKGLDLGSFAAADKPPQAQQTLSWRLPPQESLSDWAIKVQVEGSSRAADTYHCHRSVLGVGPRHSGYFKRLFQGGQFNENAYATSKHELKASAADAFPQMLDFVYTGKLEVSTRQAVALCDMANYFEIHALFDEVIAFMNDDMQTGAASETAPIYLREAELYANEKVAAAAKTLCARDFAKIEDADLAKLTPTQFTAVVHHRKLRCDAVKLSSKVAAFCEAKGEEVTPEVFRSITQHKLMSKIDAKAAVCLLKLDLAHTEAGHTDVPVGSLRKRCVVAMSTHYRELFAGGAPASPADDAPAEPRGRKRRRGAAAPVDRNPPLTELHLPGDVVTEVLQGALQVAQVALEEVGAEERHDGEREGCGEMDEQQLREGDQNAQEEPQAGDQKAQEGGMHQGLWVQLSGRCIPSPDLRDPTCYLGRGSSFQKERRAAAFS